MSADLLTQGLQMGKSLGSSTEFSTSEAPTETVSLATELRDKEDKICEVHWGQGLLGVIALYVVLKLREFLINSLI